MKKQSRHFCFKVFSICGLAAIAALVVLVYCTGPFSTYTSFNLTPDELTAARKKADSGDAEAARQLGEYNRYVALDEETAFTWYKRSAELGNVDSQFDVGRIYFRDKKDKERAIHWFRIAGQNGNRRAQEYVEVFFTPEQLEKIIKKAMDGDGPAAFQLYTYYTLIEWDRDKNKLWLKKSAENGYPEGQRIYAYFVRGEERSYWLRKAVRGGDSTALSALIKEYIKHPFGQPKAKEEECPK